MVRGQVICEYKYRYSLIYIIIPFLWNENYSGKMKAQLCREFSMIKTCSEIQNLKLTAHTRSTPEYLARNHFLWSRFSHSMRASLVLLKLPRSCPKRILGNSAIPWQGKTPDSHFIVVFFISVGPPSATSKITHRLKVLAFKTCPDCISRSWNSSTERPERQLHPWTVMFTTEHFRRPSLHETISRLCLRQDQTRTVLTLRLCL